MPVARTSPEQLVAVFRGVLPPSYVEPLIVEDDGAGMDLPYAIATMLTLADCANNRGTQAYFIRENSAQTDAPGSIVATATGTLRLTRAAGYSGEVRIPAGSFIEAFRTNSYGEDEVIGRYLTELPYTLPDGTGEHLDIAVRAENPGYFGNLYGGLSSFRFARIGTFEIPFNVGSSSTLEAIGVPAEDAWHQGCIDRYLLLTPDPGEYFIANLTILRRVETFDGNIVSITPLLNHFDGGKTGVARVVEFADVLSLQQLEPFSGGNGGILEDRGSEYNASRIVGESVAAYATRLESLSDTTSPAAITRAVDAILGPAGIAWRLLETGDPRGLGGRVWDLHPWDFGSLGSVASSASVYDVQGAVWLSQAHTRRLFVIAVSPAILAEPALASQVWNKVNNIRALGVAFRLKIDSTI